MAEWLDKIHEAQHDISVYARRLRTLANAFKTTGNQQMFDTLDAIAENIECCGHKVGEGIGQMLDGEIKASQEFNAKMISTLLDAAVK